MSRSRRHAPIVAIAGNSAGAYRKIRAGQERARARVLMAASRFDEAGVELAPWDEWACDRDGKQWVGDEPASKRSSLLRK